jgi:lysozyme family protein
MNFDECANYILAVEGGYVNHPADPGLETKFGISKRMYPTLDIKNLDEQKAKSIYKFDYWDTICADLLPKSLRLLVFDCAVNQGPGTAIKILQRTLGLKPDGHFGSITKQAIKDLDEVYIIDRYAQMRLERYQALPHWEFFGKGWSRRLLDVSLICAFMAKQNPKPFHP